VTESGRAARGRRPSSACDRVVVAGENEQDCRSSGASTNESEPSVLQSTACAVLQSRAIQQQKPVPRRRTSRNPRARSSLRLPPAARARWARSGRRPSPFPSPPWRNAWNARVTPRLGLLSYFKYLVTGGNGWEPSNSLCQGGRRGFKSLLPLQRTRPPPAAVVLLSLVTTGVHDVWRRRGCASAGDGLRGLALPRSQSKRLAVQSPLRSASPAQIPSPAPKHAAAFGRLLCFVARDDGGARRLAPSRVRVGRGRPPRPRVTAEPIEAARRSESIALRLAAQVASPAPKERSRLWRLLFFVSPDHRHIATRVRPSQPRRDHLAQASEQGHAH
jgi:hypothetical protein